MLKKRKAKNSDRGIYIQDLQLKNSVFKPGSHYKYIIDMENKELLIVPSENGGNTVSKREIKDGVKPVIDIRNRAALAPFVGMSFLEVEIFEDKVLVKGFEEEKDEKNTVVSKVKKAAKKAFNKVANIIDITEKLALKKKFEVLLSKKQLDKAVGQGFHQLSFFDLLESSDSSFSNVSSNVKEALTNAKIPLQVASLFSGAGIMDLGFVNEGFNITMALEKDEDAVKTYRHNHGDHIYNADITKFDFSKFAEDGSPVMIGGSPCQGFSNSNRYTHFLENPNNMLVNYYIKAIKSNPNCKIFILENVPQILTAGDGKFRDEICEQLSEFEITTGIINAADMGAAQSRRRAIFIGSKIGKIDLPKPEVEAEQFTTVREAFEGLNDLIPNQLDYSKPRADTIERMKYVPQGGNWADIPTHLQTDRMTSGQTHSSVYRRLEWDKPSITITNVRKSNITHPVENRSLSVREAARLFGLPDCFEFKGKLSSMQQQISNSVPVQLAKSVAKVVSKAIKQFNIRNGFEKLSLV